MPPRKAMATPKKAPGSTTPEASIPNTASKKRKIDWSTIDEQKKPFNGFKLTSVKSKPASKKQKASNPATGVAEGYRDAPLNADIVQRNPFAESDLSQTHYKVTPAALWESTLRYRKFTISEAEFEVGQTIFVKKEEDEFDNAAEIKYWIGRVLEVRAGDAAHVYLRVYWLYRPEDLPEGREPHHGSSELIASNHMDIIEALTVVDEANVIHWDENPEKPWPHTEQLFWRQTLDFTKTTADRQLSKLREFCIDQAPCNPDEPMVQCQSCSQWLHGRCLEKQAMLDALDEQTKSQAGKGKKKAESISIGGDDFTAQYVELGAGKICLTVKDNRPNQKNRRWNVDIKCLMCHALIEEAAADIPSETKIKSKTFAKRMLAPAFEEQAVLPSREVEAQPEAPVTSKEEEKDEKLPHADTSATSAPAESSITPKRNAPRGRGRPRKHPRKQTIVHDTIATESAVPRPSVANLARAESAEAESHIAKRARKEFIKAEPPLAKRVKVEETAVDEPAVVAALTPAPPVSVNENVFQSGMRSVKRLLWRTS